MKLVAKSKTELDTLIKSKKIALPIEQSFLWQHFDKKIPNRKPLGVFVAENEQGVHAVVAATRYTQSGYEWVWIKHGPYFIDANPSEEVIKATLSALVELIKLIAPRAVFVRVTTPKVRFSLKPPIHHTMYDRTIVLDIHKSDAALLESMTRSGRYDVKKSLKSGIVYSEVPTKTAIDEFHKYYSVLDETAARDGFRANEQRIYVAMLESLGAHGHLFAAHYQGDPIAWSIVTTYQGKAVYYYAASNAVARKLCAAYGLQYFAMRTVRDLGCSEYDLMGVASPDYPSYASVTGFKKKFSHEIIDIHKTFDIPLKSVKYATIKAAKKVKTVVKR